MNTVVMPIEGRTRRGGGGGGGRRHGGRRHGGRRHGRGYGRGGYGRGIGLGLGLGLLGGGYPPYGYGYGYPGGYGYGDYGYPPYGRRSMYFGDELKHEELKKHVENLKSALDDPSLSAERRIHLETLGERIDELFPAGVLIPLTENLSEEDPDHLKVKEYNKHAKQHNLLIKNGYDYDKKSTSKPDREDMQKKVARRGLRLYKLRKKLKKNGNWKPY